MQVYVHMSGNCNKKRGIPEKNNRLHGLLDPLRQRGFAVRLRSGAERVGALDCVQTDCTERSCLKITELCQV